MIAEMAGSMRLCHPRLLALAFVVWLSDAALCLSSLGHHKNECDERCGSSPIPYPFYLHSPCGIPGFRLECLNAATLSIKLNGSIYNVVSLSSDHIIIDPLNYSCQLSVSSFDFRGNNLYGISPDNFLQLSDCKNASVCIVKCNIPIQHNDTECKYSAPCCYPLSDTSLWKIGDGISSFSKFNCAAFSSWVLSPPSAHSVNAQYGLKMEWAVPGSCSNLKCAPNAECVNATIVKGGVRCRCRNGFQGDGFADGGGCYEVCIGRDGQTAYGRDCESQKSVVKIAVLLAGILAAATVLSGIAISFALIRCQKALSAEEKRREDPGHLANLLSFHGKACNTRFFTYKELERATKGFAPSEKLGNGACGTVYAGRMPGGCPVAVKKIHYGSPQGIQQVINEVNLLSTVRHPNLVCLLGCCIEMGSPLLVYEFVPNGTLAQHLQRERGGGLDWLRRITIATETAKAIAYLHSTVTPPIYHRDVKSTNILLDSDFSAKVADFGLSRLGLVEGSHISTIPQGTPGYLDPEYHQNFHLTDKSDVYSFGVVLIELITAMKPVDFSREKKEVNLAALALSKIASGCLNDIIDPFLQIHKQPLVWPLVQRVAELAFRSLSFDKDARPTMIEVAEELLLIRKDSLLISTCSPQENFCDSSLEREISHEVVTSPSSIQAPWTSNDSFTSDSASGKVCTNRFPLHSIYWGTF